MAEIKCPCRLRNYMEEEDCKKTNCNDCCPLTKPQTNADRIRAMSDEELAERLIFWNNDWGRWETDAGNIDGDPVDTLQEAIQAELEWLKQPMKDE